MDWRAELDDGWVGGGGDRAEDSVGDEGFIVGVGTYTVQRSFTYAYGDYTGQNIFDPEISYISLSSSFVIYTHYK